MCVEIERCPFLLYTDGVNIHKRVQRKTTVQYRMSMQKLCILYANLQIKTIVFEKSTVTEISAVQSQV